MLLHSNILGEGKPFVILHGFVGMGDNWKSLGKRFSEQGCQVHLVDQRNHGRSFHSKSFNYNFLTEDLNVKKLSNLIFSTSDINALNSFLKLKSFGSFNFTL